MATLEPQAMGIALLTATLLPALQGELYRGARLAAAGEWAATHGEALNPLEREFLAASRAWAEQEEAEREAQRLREMPPWRKLALAGEMYRTVRSLALAGLRQRYPDESPGQRERRLADLLLGPELAARAYGPMQKAD
jgi:hypothetical protein